MKNESKIYAVTVFLMLLLLISPIAGARHEAYSAAPSSDEGIHSFFSDVIRDAGICLDNFVDESPDAEKFSTSLESKIDLTEEESRFYAAKGIESNVSLVVKPFSTLSEGVEKIAVNQNCDFCRYHTSLCFDTKHLTNQVHYKTPIKKKDDYSILI